MKMVLYCFGLCFCLKVYWFMNMFEYHHPLLVGSPRKGWAASEKIPWMESTWSVSQAEQFNSLHSRIVCLSRTYVDHWIYWYIKNLWIPTPHVQSCSLYFICLATCFSLSVQGQGWRSAPPNLPDPVAKETAKIRHR